MAVRCRDRVTLYVGGASSGKSLLAERRCEEIAAERLYVATMRPGDEESLRRVAVHRARRGAGWTDVEAGMDLAACLGEEPSRGVVLVDGVGLWIAGMLFGLYGPCDPERDIPARVEDFCRGLAASRRPCVVVTDEAGMGLVPSDGTSRRFRTILGNTNQRLALAADSVYFVSCGLALRLKGEERTPGAAGA